MKCRAAAIGLVALLSSSTAVAQDDGEEVVPRQTNQTAAYILTGLGLGALGAGTAIAAHVIESNMQDSPNKVPGYVLGGVGLGSLVAGSFLGIMALEQKGIRDDHCSETQRLCDAKGIDAANTGRRYANWSMLSLATGGVALAGSIYLFRSADDTTRIDSQVSTTSLRLRLVTRW